MNVVIGIASRQGPDQNPLLKRCLESIGKFEAGIGFEARIEVSEALTRGEKRQRIFTYAKQRHIPFVCIMEDDTEVLHDGWLANLVSTGISDPMIGIVNPLESRDGTFPGFPEQARGLYAEAFKLFGFCMLYSMDRSPIYDPRVTHLDDLAMSLACRADGRKLAICGTTTIRHTKQPFLPDETPPWDQGDRERWGKDSVYYSKDKHFETRLHEARYLVARWGDMAAEAIPPELAEEMCKRAEAEKVTGPA